MTRMAPLLRWKKRGSVSAPSPPTFYYRRGTLEQTVFACFDAKLRRAAKNAGLYTWPG